VKILQVKGEDLAKRLLEKYLPGEEYTDYNDPILQECMTRRIASHGVVDDAEAEILAAVQGWRQ
jgi:hypothetical protein